MSKVVKGWDQGQVRHNDWMMGLALLIMGVLVIWIALFFWEK